MNVRVAVLSFALALFLAMPMWARAKTDVLVMTNGDHLTCEIKGLNEGVLYVSFDYILSTQSVQWSKVAYIESKQLFVVRTVDGSVYTGTLSTAEMEEKRPVEIEVMESPEKQVELPRTQVIKMAQTSDKFWQRFSGELNSGIIYSKANQNTQYEIGADLAYLRERWSASANYNSTLSTSNGTSSAATRNQLTLSAERLLRWNHWFYTGIGTFLQSSEQDINLQTNIGAGVGRYLKNTNRSTIAVYGGLAWQGTQYSQSLGTVPAQNLAAAMLGGEMKFFKFNKTNLNLSATAFPALTEPGRIFLNTNATYYIKITGDLSWNVSFYGNWDNEPPPHFSGSDYGTSSGLSYSFGLK